MSREVLNDNGFTLIELLLVVALTLVLVTATIPLYGNLHVSAQLNENVSQIVQTVRTARARSVGRFNDSPHGVYFEINGGGDDRFVLYQGASYGARDPAYDRVITLDSALSLSTTLAGDEINFSRGLGVPTTTGAVVITHEVSGTGSLTINSLGVVEAN